MHHHLDQPILSIKEIDLSPGRKEERIAAQKPPTHYQENRRSSSRFKTVQYLESFPAFRLGVPSGGDADLDVDDPGGDIEVLAAGEVGTVTSRLQ